MRGLRNDALKGGFKAVVNFRLSDGTWKAQGSAWRVLMTQMCGDLVKVAPK
ncbi:hypothetical protein Atc_1148 [Acidithiobacillus caldus SM-1]|jgi:hypothetical protein|uniref:Uncharacterized protein n=1 Tax=Acidithiobacillus caldus (strain SM-1) TaxID=990288 RepID=F9ZLC8_ACICS|nr:hypothetical protein Atc_1148 [Acidithiobacillus caldus SM-1]QER43177.1 hypothetical protein F0726_00085 [Acidithiobacillus caldus]